MRWLWVEGSGGGGGCVVAWWLGSVMDMVRCGRLEVVGSGGCSAGGLGHMHAMGLFRERTCNREREKV